MDETWRPPTDAQAAYWTALRRPLGGAECSEEGTGELEHRLDEVAGPGNWGLIASAAPWGVCAVLSIDAPDARGGLGRVSRTGCAGPSDSKGRPRSPEAMLARAFRRAAASFGIYGRRSGIALPAGPADAPTPPRQRGPGVPEGRAPGEPREGRRREGRREPARPRDDPGRDGGLPAPPYGTAGTAEGYKWAMRIAELTGLNVMGRMGDYARKKGRGVQSKSWDRGFYDEVLERADQWVRGQIRAGGGRRRGRESRGRRDRDDRRPGRGDEDDEDDDRGGEIPPEVRARVEADPFVGLVRQSFPEMTLEAVEVEVDDAPGQAPPPQDPVPPCPEPVPLPPPEFPDPPPTSPPPWEPPPSIA